MPDDSQGKQLALTGIVAAMFCACALLSVLGPIVWSSGRPVDRPATPLSAGQLAQRPLLLYPQAAEISVSREIRRYGPDEPRPKRPRYLERRTEYRVDAPSGEIAGFYHTTLTRHGWTRCRMGSGTGGQYFWYQRATSACVNGAQEEIFVLVGNTSRVVVRETLPPPQEWPEPVVTRPTGP